MTYSNYHVGERWLEGKRATGHSMFTDGKTVWSWGEHFPIATKVGEHQILLNTEKYSSSTSKHQTFVGYALTKWRVNNDITYCDTEEINNYLADPSKPIIVKDQRHIPNINEALAILRTACKNEGMKRYPAKEVEELIKKKMFLQNI